MDAKWINEYETTCAYALSAEWFVSPLEYSWPNGKVLADKAFQAMRTQSNIFDDMLAPSLYRVSMQFDFRAKMMVFAFMREDIAKTYGLEIDSGLMSFYGLDFFSCLSQWIPVVEGYARQIFQVKSYNNVKPTGWTTPTTGDALRDRTIQSVCSALGNYFNNVIYRKANDSQTTTLSRHIMLHGNLQNNQFYSQKNCLNVMFVLDALVFIEAVNKGNFPQVFDNHPGEAERIVRRSSLYEYEMSHAMSDPYLLKRELLKEHV